MGGRAQVRPVTRRDGEEKRGKRERREKEEKEKRRRREGEERVCACSVLEYCTVFCVCYVRAVCVRAVCVRVSMLATSHGDDF
jgi:hypothetical protein